MKLIALEKVKTFLEKTDTTHDALLSMIIESVSSRIALFLNRNLEKTSRTEYFNGGRRYYYVSAPPIDTTVAVSAYTDDTLETEDTDYFVWEDEGLVEFYWKVPTTEPKNVRIVYTGGYTTVNQVLQVPDDIERACLYQTVSEFRGRNSVGLASISMPDGSVQNNNPTELLPEVKSILKNYRKAAQQK